LVCMFIAYMLYLYIWPYTSYGMAMGESCSGWLLPILFQSGVISINLPKTILHLGMLLLLCDAPFFSPVMPYMVLRSRRNGWWLGSCLYIMGTAFLYALFITVCSMMLTLPVITLENDWGGVMHDFVFGKKQISVVELYQSESFAMALDGAIVRYCYPIGAQLYTFAAVWCSFSFLGLLMYLVSLIKKNVLIGMSVAAVFIFLDPFLVYTGQQAKWYWVEIFSPVCWSSIDQTQSVNRFNIMSIPLALALYAVLIILLCLAIRRWSKRVMIELIR